MLFRLPPDVRIRAMLLVLHDTVVFHLPVVLLSTLHFHCSPPSKSLHPPTDQREGWFTLTSKPHPTARLFNLTPTLGHLDEEPQKFISQDWESPPFLISLLLYSPPLLACCLSTVIPFQNRFCQLCQNTHKGVQFALLL